MSGGVRRWAEVSDDGRFRYLLGREWDAMLPQCGFIMLNPSTADAVIDDRTIHRCMRIARQLGCGSILVANMYAFRSTSPKALELAGYPTGGDRNEQAILKVAQTSSTTIAAWGNLAEPQRVKHVATLLDGYDLVTLKINKSGSPSHPLYAPAPINLLPWQVTQNV